jgi:hypothetical protein
LPDKAVALIEQSMPELFDSFDINKSFDREAYFTILYNKLASKLVFETPLEEKREIMEAVLSKIDLAAHELQLVYKYWNVEDVNRVNPSNDFPYEYFFKSDSRKLLISISLEYKELTVEFLYDSADTTTEEWILSTHRQLKLAFGADKKPTFKVLSKGSYFSTEDIETQPHELNLNLYNDDFKEIHELIEKSLLIDKSGLILLHGLPGTGKTSYIKSLIGRHSEKSFIFIQNEFVNELLRPDFISFLLKHQNAILIIEDAEKVLTSREQVNESSVVSTILQLTDGLFSDFLNIKIICTFNTSIAKIDKALLRKGRMIAHYEFKALASEKVKGVLASLNHSGDSSSMTLADIFNFDDRAFEQLQKQQIGF